MRNTKIKVIQDPAIPEGLNCLARIFCEKGWVEYTMRLSSSDIILFHGQPLREIQRWPHKVILVFVWEWTALDPSWVSYMNSSKCLKVVVPSKWLYELLLQYIENKQKLVLIPYPILEISPLSSEVKSLNKTRGLQLSAHCSFHWRKGIVELVRALLNWEFKSYKLILTSLNFSYYPLTSEYIQELKELVARSPNQFILRVHPTIKGHPRERINKIMQRSHFGICPSWAEGFGLVPYEYIANDCIPIMTPTPHWKDDFGAEYPFFLPSEIITERHWSFPFPMFPAYKFTQEGLYQTLLKAFSLTEDAYLTLLNSLKKMILTKYSNTLLEWEKLLKECG